jgi:hypothetical protein
MKATSLYSGYPGHPKTQSRLAACLRASQANLRHSGGYQQVLRDTQATLRHSGGYQHVVRAKKATLRPSRCSRHVLRATQAIWGTVKATSMYRWLPGYPKAEWMLSACTKGYSGHLRHQWDYQHVLLATQSTIRLS